MNIEESERTAGARTSLAPAAPPLLRQTITEGAPEGL